MLLHDVTVRARVRIIDQIRGPARIHERERADAQRNARDQAGRDGQTVMRQPLRIASAQPALLGAAVLAVAVLVSTTTATRDRRAP